MTRVYKPKGDWQPKHPMARRIADEMRPYPALLNLRRRYLVAALREKYRCGQNTAYYALRFAEKDIAE